MYRKSNVVILSLPTLGWLTCATADCSCKFHGQELDRQIYENYPTGNPGKYKDLSGIALYGTTCAAWDQMPNTPYYSDYCPRDTANWDDKNYNWCQQPWCYVDKSCASAVESTVFTGSDVAYYSYLACGNTADCYSNIAFNNKFRIADWPNGCPYDPTGENTYMTHKGGDCNCIFQGTQISRETYQEYGLTGDFQLYGTSCAAWDMMPKTPFASQCLRRAANLCHPNNNWCQAPWCYVSEKCSTAVPSSDKSRYWSYDTCISTPDCQTNIAGNEDWSESTIPNNCPFDSTVNNWYTIQMCPLGWSRSLVRTDDEDEDVGRWGGSPTLLVMVVAMSGFAV